MYVMNPMEKAFDVKEVVYTIKADKQSQNTPLELFLSDLNKQFRVAFKSLVIALDAIRNSCLKWIKGRTRRRAKLKGFEKGSLGNVFYRVGKIQNVLINNVLLENDMVLRLSVSIIILEVKISKMGNSAAQGIKVEPTMKMQLLFSQKFHDHISDEICFKHILCAKGNQTHLIGMCNTKFTIIGMCLRLNASKRVYDVADP
ncbi:hypothetical protein Tco_0436516 [Tanacetum coccineum]